MNSSLRTAGRLLPFALATALLTACSDSAVGPGSPNESLAAAAAAQSASAATGSNTKTSATTGATSTLTGTATNTPTDALSGPSTMTVGVLSFRTGVNTDVSAKKVIGPEGGSLTLAETGFTLWVPPGAVSRATTFKVKPVVGGLVAYDFEPHGTRFTVPLIFKQDLAKTNYVPGMALQGAYFPDADKVSGTSKSAVVSELFSITFGDGGWAFFTITHFSGYLVSCA